VALGRAPRIACKRESVVITQFEPAEEIYVFDHAGRLFSVWRGNRLYRRALDGRVMEKHTDRTRRHPRRHRRFLEHVERSALIDSAAHAAAGALSAFRAGRAELLWSLPGTVDVDRAERLVSLGAEFDAGAAAADARRFASVYTPIGILPPDRYLALVVQVTEGCHWNRCTFCSFYRERPFRIKPYAAFVDHVDAVIGYFGDGLRLRRGIFLGDANALLLPADDLSGRLDHLAARLPEQMRDLSAFIDVFTGRRRSGEDFAALAARGLRRIYLGLESGDDTVLALLNKPQSAADGVALVRAAKAAGLQVGVIVMAGVGGRELQEKHVRATLDALSRMRLGGGDLVYVSAFDAPPDGPYASRAREMGLSALDEDEVADQADVLLRNAAQASGPGLRAAPYDIREFLY
jgi:hypothetical protein